MTVERCAGIIVQGGVIINLEALRQNQLTDQFLECLAAALHAVGLKAVTEYLMEEHAAGRSRHDGRTGIGLGNRCLAQSQQTLYQVFYGFNQDLIGWEVFK